jgi:hypothetical protein
VSPIDPRTYLAPTLGQHHPVALSVSRVGRAVPANTLLVASR